MIEFVKIYEYAKMAWEIILTDAYRKQFRTQFDSFKTQLMNKMLTATENFCEYIVVKFIVIKIQIKNLIFRVTEALRTLIAKFNVLKTRLNNQTTDIAGQPIEIELREINGVPLNWHDE